MKILLPLLAVILFITSCSVTKRHYRSGYHFELKKHAATSAHAGEANNTAGPGINAREKTAEIVVAANPETSSIKTLIKEVVVYYTKPKIKTIERCDTIILKSGKRLIGNVTEINPTEIKYTDCNGTGVTHIALINEVNKIIYDNGFNEEYNVSAPIKEPLKEKHIHRRLEPIGVISLILLFAGILAISVVGAVAVLIGVLAVILAITSLIRITSNKEKFFGMVFPILTLSLITAFLLFILLLLAAFAG